MKYEIKVVADALIDRRTLKYRELRSLLDQTTQRRISRNEVNRFEAVDTR